MKHISARRLIIGGVVLTVAGALIALILTVSDSDGVKTQAQIEQVVTTNFATTLLPLASEPTESTNTPDEPSDDMDSMDSSNVPKDYEENLSLIKSNSTRNADADSSPWASSKASEITYSGLTTSTNNPAPSGRSKGIFHETCSFSHFAYDDFIVTPNMPGTMHLHMFFGNTNANAFSDNDSLRNEGASTCIRNELNRSSYWIPAVFNGDNQVLIPEDIMVYYTERADTNVEPFPEDFRMIAGDAMATSEQEPSVPGNRVIYWKCGFFDKAQRTGGGSGGDSAGTIPSCDPSVYSHMEMKIEFPNCWDGENDGKQGNHRSHMSYPVGLYNACPAGTITLPSIIYRIHFKLGPETGPTNQWYLSSDVRIKNDGDLYLNEEKGASIHADWVNGWNAETMRTAIDSCLNEANKDCWRELGDGQSAIPDTKYDDKKATAYKGPLALDPQEVASLCKGRAEVSGLEASYCDKTMMQNMMN